MRRRLAALCLLLATAACHHEPRGTARVPTPQPGDPIPPGGPISVGVKVDLVTPPKPTPAATVSGRLRGVPHHAQILAVVSDVAGTMALSRDQLGAVRIWPALDGSREPQVVPVRAPEAMAIGPRADGSLAALIDGAGMSTIIRFDSDGLVRAIATLPPDLPLSGVVILPGGERIAAVRSDQRVLLLDADGAELSRLGVRGARVVSLLHAGDGLVAVLRRVVDEQPRFELRRVTVTDDVLAWSGEAVRLADPVAVLPHVAASVSPDGALLAYLATDTAGTVARVVRIDSGAALELDDEAVATLPGSTMIGFTDDSHVELAANGGNAWQIVLDGAGRGTVLTKAMAAGTSAPTFARGLRLTGYHAQLALHEDDGDLFYLGHREMAPSSGSLAPDGKSAAWITSSGAVVVQRFDGSDDVRIKGPGDWYGMVAIVDDDNVLIGRNNGQLALFDSRTGVERASMVVSQSTPWFMYEPATKLVAVMRDTGVIWVMKIDPTAARPIGAPIALTDGAQNFTLLIPSAAGGDALMTMDPSMTTRRYSWAELEDGVSATEMKQERVSIGSQAWYFDRAGHHYVGIGTGVEIRDGANLVTTIATPTGFGGLWAAPAGDRLLVLDGAGVGPLRAYDSAGKELWAASTTRGVFAASWSNDGKRLMLVTQGGAAIVDGDTGESTLIATGWAFSRTHEAPSSFPPGIEPAFTFSD